MFYIPVYFQMGTTEGIIFEKVSFWNDADIILKGGGECNSMRFINYYIDKSNYSFDIN